MNRNLWLIKPRSYVNYRFNEWKKTTSFKNKIGCSTQISSADDSYRRKNIYSIIWNILFSIHAHTGQNISRCPYQTCYCYLAWGVAVAWVAVSCCSGHGGLVNSALSYRGLLPLSRLTYCAYLVHPTIMMYTSFLLDGPYHMQNSTVVSTTLPWNYIWKSVLFFVSFVSFLWLWYFFYISLSYVWCILSLPCTMYYRFSSEVKKVLQSTKCI